eukprot:225402-Amphidinium_carterae.1
MPSLPKQQLHRRNPPTAFEGNNKSNQTAGSSTAFKNCASELQIYMSLEAHNWIDIMNNVRRQSTPIYDDNFIKHEVDKERARGERNEPTPNEELLPQAPDLPNDYEPFTEETRKTISHYREAFYYYSSNTL